jgi:predicted Zn finger-like uncharacterized protein
MAAERASSLVACGIDAYGLAMIIACPACATRYAVPDSAIGIDGRTVRCAKCRHAWFQEGPRQPELTQPELTMSTPDPGIAAPARPMPATEQAKAEPVAAAPRPAPPPSPPPPPAAPPAPAAPAAPAPAASLPEMGAGVSRQAEPSPFADQTARSPRIYGDEPGEVPSPGDDGPSSFAYEPPFRPRRNPARLWMAMAVGFALVVAATIGAVAWFGLPAWVPMARATFASERPDLKLDFPANRQERRPLPNGTDFFNVSGTITNISQKRQPVPMLLIVLRDKYNRIVYSVEAPPARGVLAPGESETVNQAIIDAPKSARSAEIGWKPD